MISNQEQETPPPLVRLRSACRYRTAEATIVGWHDVYLYSLILARKMIRSKYSLFYLIVLVVLFAANLSESQEMNNGDDDDYIDLVDMTDDELEEICTSRGFELVREDGQVYTHQDYVDAASECLQIETDL